MNYQTLTFTEITEAIKNNWDRTHPWSKDVEEAFNQPVVKEEYSYEWLKVTCNLIANMVGDKKLTAEQWWELLNNELK